MNLRDTVRLLSLQVFGRDNIEALIVGGDCRNMFLGQGWLIHHLGLREHIDDLLDFNLVVLNGGTDISPSIYHQEKHPYTDIPDIPRDLAEMAIIKLAIKQDIPIVGICRGAQLLNVMNGGSLLQHDNTIKDLNGHRLELEDGSIMPSAHANHHQLMVNGKGGMVIAQYDNIPEIVLYADTRSLCVQYHPEWHQPEDVQQKYFFSLLELIL